jgi:pentapeptide MXKDX repeat protein
MGLSAPCIDSIRNQAARSRWAITFLPVRTGRRGRPKATGPCGLPVYPRRFAALCNLPEECHVKKRITLFFAGCLALAASGAFAQDTMKKDPMAKDSMGKDGMKKDSMNHDGMKKDGKKKKDKMKKDSMSHDGMKKDTMGKDSMGKDSMAK